MTAFSCVLVAVVACSAPAAPISNVASASSTLPYSACPDLLVPDTWMFELFPGCPTPPFGTAFPVCTGACPTPCAVIANGARRQITYDPKRQWSATSSAATIIASCRYDGAQVASCTQSEGTYTFVRGSRGEILEASAPPNGQHLRYRYSSNGDLVELAEWDLVRRDWHVASTFEYVAHRLVAQHRSMPPDLTYRYEGPRLVERDEAYASELVRTRFAYDDRGRLRAVDSGPTSGFDDFVPYRIAYEYDARDRVIRATHTDGEGTIETTTFDYDCRASAN